jgi:hypothetical protein
MKRSLALLALLAAAPLAAETRFELGYAHVDEIDGETTQEGGVLSGQADRALAAARHGLRAAVRGGPRA